jgi:hypothetical protein
MTFPASEADGIRMIGGDTVLKPYIDKKATSLNYSSTTTIYSNSESINGKSMAKFTMYHGPRIFPACLMVEE